MRVDGISSAPIQTSIGQPPPNPDRQPALPPSLPESHTAQAARTQSALPNGATITPPLSMSMTAASNDIRPAELMAFETWHTPSADLPTLTNTPTNITPPDKQKLTPPILADGRPAAQSLAGAASTQAPNNANALFDAFCRTGQLPSSQKGLEGDITDVIIEIRDKLKRNQKIRERKQRQKRNRQQQSQTSDDETTDDSEQKDPEEKKELYLIELQINFLNRDYKNLRILEGDWQRMLQACRRIKKQQHAR